MLLECRHKWSNLLKIKVLYYPVTMNISFHHQRKVTEKKRKVKAIYSSNIQ